MLKIDNSNLSSIQFCQLKVWSLRGLTKSRTYCMILMILIWFVEDFEKLVNERIFAPNGQFPEIFNFLVKENG